jgi:high affinity Mn2+ porin
LGGGTEDIPDGQLQLASRQDVSRLTLSAGKLNAKDYFDTNAYANDPHTQFLNWSLMANGAWDYPADSLGYMPGFVMDLHEQTWSARYGVFQVPRVANGLASDPHVLQAWGMATEFEHRHEIGEHPGAVRFLAFLNRATMGSYSATLDDPSLGADIKLTERYRYKFGFGLNAEQELSKTVGMFFRLGWNDGKTESWAFTDVDRSLSLGARIKGDRWGRAEDAFGIAGIVNAISSGHSALLAAGGMGILVGDGRLTYDTERILEAYYDIHIWKSVHTAVDYQFIENPGYNRDRGPVSVIAARLHWEF